MPQPSSIAQLLSEALREDSAFEDVTVALLGEKGRRIGRAVIRSREGGVFSGVALTDALSSLLSPQIQITLAVQEGQRFEGGDEILSLKGPVGLCLSLERTLLNFLSHTCGIATLTRRYVEKVGSHPTKILATRKTIPGLREVELAAVAAGGGTIHRRSLSDGILIKENHQALSGTEELLKQAHARRSPLHGIEIEIQQLSLLPVAIAGRPDVIMLDNLAVDQMRVAVREIREKLPSCRIEVSGGMTLERISDVAALGVDYISVGALTHSVRALDLGLDIDWEGT